MAPSDDAVQQSLEIESSEVKSAETHPQTTTQNKRDVIRYDCQHDDHDVVVSRRWLVSKSIQHFLPLGFLFVLVVALAFPYPGKKVKDWTVQGYGIVDTFNVAVIFLISGLTLKTEDIWAAFKAYPGLIYGLLAILFITPCLGFGLIELPLSPDEFTIGLAIFSAVPTTLTSGVTMVTQAYGNGTLALMLTVVSNLLGILTVPFSIRLIVATGTDVRIDAVALLIKLALTILIPLVVGKTIRESSQIIQNFIAKHKVALSLIGSTNLICIVWQNLSDSRDKILDQKAVDILIVIVAGIVFHVVLLTVNFMAVTLLGLEERERKAVLLMSSQKTLPVSVTVISYLNADEVGDLGLITIPCIVAHISQIFMDAFITSRWASQYLKRNENSSV